MTIVTLSDFVIMSIVILAMFKLFVDSLRRADILFESMDYGSTPRLFGGSSRYLK